MRRILERFGLVWVSPEAPPQQSPPTYQNVANEILAQTVKIEFDPYELRKKIAVMRTSEGKSDA